VPLLQLIVAHPAGSITDADLGTIKRAQAILSDTTMSELIDEDPKAHESLNDALRHQVVVSCQRLRVYLEVIDRLMAIYNQSVASSKPL
jgi:hypothetical protein